MNNFLYSIALSYFNNMGLNYNLSELKQLLGFVDESLDDLINNLINEGYIEYNNYELQITDKGKIHLISTNNTNINFGENEYIMKNIHPDKAINVNDIYVPKYFSSKKQDNQ